MRPEYLKALEVPGATTDAAFIARARVWAAGERLALSECLAAVGPDAPEAPGLRADIERLTRALEE